MEEASVKLQLAGRFPDQNAQIKLGVADISEVQLHQQPAKIPSRSLFTKDRGDEERNSDCHLGCFLAIR